ncbi:trypsin-like peptidase domain-containing protein [Thiothrix eikelboomii]|uniref:trypsin-like peptidase domain-containing protein n=1 Tax=Thiothrix eikelboomii TaxID=92487 RepID=UPI003BB0410A
MINLAVGANLALESDYWRLSLRFKQSIKQEIGLAVLPLNEARQLVAPAQLGHLPDPVWMTTTLDEDGCGYGLSLAVKQLPNPNITRLCVVLYRYGAFGPLNLGEQVSLSLPEVFQHTLPLATETASAMIIAEFYLKQAKWKVRALAESSAYGLAALGRRMGQDIDEGSPFVTQGRPDAGRQSQEAWTGSAFLVAPQVFMTNAHVVEGAQHIQLSSMQGKMAGEVLISDATNDLALIRVSTGLSVRPLPFRQTQVYLAEAITTLGYPLASLMGSGVQVTQGVISGLFGAHNDVRLLQFTAPIQPGSSGSPLLDSQGGVLGVVSSSFTNTQNMNFAIRGVLAVALLEAAQVEHSKGLETAPILTAAQIVSQTQLAIWRVECRA